MLLEVIGCCWTLLDVGLFVGRHWILLDVVVCGVLMDVVGCCFSFQLQVVGYCLWVIGYC